MNLYKTKRVKKDVNYSRPGRVIKTKQSIVDRNA